MKGFALLFSVLFLLLLTLFGLAMLSIAEGYYASTRHLVDDQNARIACEQATRQLIDRHNLEPAGQRFFFDPGAWNGLELKPFDFSDFTISGSLQDPWTSIAPNVLTISARKGPHVALQEIRVGQRRLENFALYSDADSVLPGESLVDGLVFSREPLNLIEPGVEFREIVQAEVTPEYFASFRKKTQQQLEYPRISELMNIGQYAGMAKQTGLAVKHHDVSFWKTDHYELDLAQLLFETRKKKWDITYNGVLLGSVADLVLYFDGPLTVKQSDRPQSFLPSKPEAALIVVSNSTLRISAGLHDVGSASFRHPLCLISGASIHLTSELPLTVSIQACLIALGSESTDGQQTSLTIESASLPASETHKTEFLDDFRASSALLHESVLNATTLAVQSDEQVVWIRGGLILESGFSLPSDLRQLHLQASTSIFPKLPALPFVYSMEGTQQWQ